MNPIENGFISYSVKLLPSDRWTFQLLVYGMQTMLFPICSIHIHLESSWGGRRSLEEDSREMSTMTRSCQAAFSVGATELEKDGTSLECLKGSPRCILLIQTPRSWHRATVTRDWVTASLFVRQPGGKWRGHDDKKSFKYWCSEGNPTWFTAELRRAFNIVVSLQCSYRLLLQRMLLCYSQEASLCIENNGPDGEVVNRLKNLEKAVTGKHCRGLWGTKEKNRSEITIKPRWVEKENEVVDISLPFENIWLMLIEKGEHAMMGLTASQMMFLIWWGALHRCNVNTQLISCSILQKIHKEWALFLDE